MSAAALPLDLFGVLWRLSATLFFVALNGFFVAAEFALVKVRSSRVEQLAEAGGAAAQRVKHILEHLGPMRATVLDVVRRRVHRVRLERRAPEPGSGEPS